MKKFIGVLSTNILFKGIDTDNLEKILDCLSGRIISYKKNDNIILSGEEISFIGIVLSGKIRIIKEDIEGNINILANLGVSEVFAEALASAQVKESPVTVQASEDSEILRIDYKRIITPCSNICIFHSKLIENMISLIARKNILLNQKIEIMSKRTTRDKLLMFFNMQKSLSKSKKFTIPFNREALADYLSVDRSAMSRELCKMRDEGVLEFKKNEFELL